MTEKDRPAAAAPGPLFPPDAEAAQARVQSGAGMEMFGLNAYSPREIAQRVQSNGVTKARLPLLSQFLLAVLAGAFIGLGALYFVVVRSDPALGYAATQVLGGVTFSVGLVMVVVAGAELFTGNNLLVMARAHGLISSAEVMRNWAIVFAGNLVGCVGLAILVYLSRHADTNGGAIGREYLEIAAAKAALPFWVAFFRGVLCNSLVCLAVWMSMAGRSVIDKVIALVFPISAFIASGFEHSIANLYFFSMALLLQEPGSASLLPGMARNLVAVVAGNVFGGSVLVGLVYYLIYIRGMEQVSDSGGAGEQSGKKLAAPADRRTVSLD